jgi:hypothetical protein
LRLFKCFDSHCVDEKNKVIAIFAENQQAALLKCLEIHQNLDTYENPHETIMNEWITDEYYIPPNCDVYICYPNSIHEESDIRLIMVSDDVKDIEQYIYEQLVLMESDDEIFRSYASSYCIDFGLLEEFYKVNGKYAFNDLYEDFPPRDDILEMFNGDMKKANQYIDEYFVQNVRDFFSDCPILGNTYLSYLRSHDEDELDEDFYIYVASKVMNDNSWITYDDIRKVDIVANPFKIEAALNNLENACRKICKVNVEPDEY